MNRVALPAGVKSTDSCPAMAFFKRPSSSFKNSFQERKRSSEVTRNPRSMKKLSVVCQAGPKSSIVPRPKPSRFQRNSFRPLDKRVDSCISGARVVPTAPMGPFVWPILPAGGIPPGVERETLRLVPAPVPIPSLLSSPIVKSPFQPQRCRPWRIHCLQQRYWSLRKLCLAACPLLLSRGTLLHPRWPTAPFELPQLHFLCSTAAHDHAHLASLARFRAQ